MCVNVGGFLRVLQFPLSLPLQNSNGCRPLKLFQIQKDFNFTFLVVHLPAFTPRVCLNVFLSCVRVCVCCKACNT